MILSLNLRCSRLILPFIEGRTQVQLARNTSSIILRSRDEVEVEKNARET